MPTKKTVASHRFYYQEGIRRAPPLLRLPKADTKIWRFMPVSKFLDVIARKSIFLTQLSKFQSSDPHEGSLAFGRLSYLQRIMNDDSFARQELHIDEGQPIPTEIRAAYDPRLTAWQNQISAERIYVNCWHISAVESAHLWSTYAAFGEGVAIQTSVGALSRSLINKAHITIAPVRYIDYQNFEIGPSLEDASFYKRLSFKAERELRIRYLLPFEQCAKVIDGKTFWKPPVGIYLPIDCATLIENVYISPTLSAWFGDTITRLLAQLGIEKNVVRSSILDPRIL